MSRAFTILFVVVLWALLTLLTHGETITGFQLTGPLEQGIGAVPTFTVGPRFTIIADDPTLRRMLFEMDGKRVVLRIEVKK